MSTPKKTESAKTIICNLIPKSQTDAQIIAAVLKVHPESAVDGKHMAKYRRELLIAGTIDGRLAAVNSVDHKTWAGENVAASKTKKCPHHAHWIQRDKEAKAKAIQVKKDAAAAKKAAAATKKAA